ncbi:MAG TPA: hypothetical protein VHM19_04940 [Polyangiales bacterium]|nr:hypothetical protein [Polyangiales bacterium]
MSKAIVSKGRGSLRLPATISLSLVTLFSVTGCQGVIWGNMAVLAMSVGIFLGTLSLGRSR